MEDHHNRRSDLLLLFLIFLFTATAAAASPVTVVGEEKVKLDVYYEALCPSCENFIVNYLYKIFDNGVISIVDLKLSPYGNAKISSNGTIVCQVTSL
ncbi:Gamma interferon inducible lysosomal thiol reductase GILT [Cynara cardunculus var. scolymus]|uniref:Gamma interferon inducible lysosomal thiol reductase GILT n=1 Tax=Cynara cardunculus var. scolymus TaxID=59895 RepID=A0A118K228_CYNCS|nr:Gamma interferon inducible lysosomal thiol reductase GILT [Cynara cardunculus var. scolymus]